MVNLTSQPSSEQTDQRKEVLQWISHLSRLSARSAGGSCLPEAEDGHLEARPTKSSMGDPVRPVVDSSRLGALDGGQEGSLG